MTLVYKYGLPLGPTENANLVFDQISKAHKYRNKLVEIEIEKRTKIREFNSYDNDILLLEQKEQQTKDQKLSLEKEIKTKEKIIL